MNKTLITTVFTALMLSAPASAQTQPQPDSQSVLVGAGSGAVFGAAVAGPVGFAVGGIIGLLIGNDHVQHQQLSSVTQALEDEQQALLAASQSLYQYQLALDQAHIALKQAKLSELMTQVQFKTDDAAISPLFHPHLDKLVALMEQDAELQLSIQGHADTRGEQDYNFALSQQRAQNIQHYLVAAGIDAQRLTVLAFGESESQGQNSEDYFFDRKVVLRLNVPTDSVTVKR